jgi:diguanylate cyclase (GGDEF)-like protein/PAS domain S-box-containing protein
MKPLTPLSPAQNATCSAWELTELWLAVFASTPDLVLFVTPNGYLLEANPALRRLKGWQDMPLDELQRIHITQLYPSTLHVWILNQVLTQAVQQHTYQAQTLWVDQSGQQIPISQLTIAYCDAQQQLQFFAIIARNISDLVEQEQLGRLFAQIFATTKEGIIITDPEGTIQRVNPAFSSVTGYSAKEAAGQNPRLLQSGQQDASFYQRLWTDLAATGYWQGEIWNRRKNGEVYPEWLNISAIRDDAGNVTNYVGIFSDISTIKVAEGKLTHLAHHDALTNLPNRVLFQEKLNLAIRQAESSGENLAVLFLDLDNFKPVNDTLGHRIGDLLLQAVAERLAATIRTTDTVARIGGDEFTIVLTGFKTLQNVSRVAEKLLQAISHPYLLEAHLVKIGVSIGISIYPNDGQTAEELLLSADMAMYFSKRQGRNRFQFYSAMNRGY